MGPSRGNALADLHSRSRKTWQGAESEKRGVRVRDARHALLAARPSTHLRREWWQPSLPTARLLWARLGVSRGMGRKKTIRRLSVLFRFIISSPSSPLLLSSLPVSPFAFLFYFTILFLFLLELLPFFSLWFPFLLRWPRGEKKMEGQKGFSLRTPRAPRDPSILPYCTTYLPTYLPTT
ncbi:hypothetical protein GGS23DRAFT_576437 [Durotheca rogersii]|uniref:uncharacterized protein n=1 Tax=Durotheca rogersii TaxID=419775 RepID=UPI00221E6949|nr:uncharacterized protein GGS23DRAFT_576437 [Durotheca rogersii]KAI5861349.1 hypothetical protein GGS23DRAFT_576437 [Durotheca rogersii]